MIKATLAEHLQALWDEYEMWRAPPPEDSPGWIAEMIYAQRPIREKQAEAIIKEVDDCAKLLRKFRRRLRQAA